MEQLPKIVQQRLQGPAQPGVHPDPDLLTAFAEKSLNDRERAHVLQHLVQCADCREVLSLATPAIEPALAPGPETSKWLSWPVLRWGALAACVVVVSAAVTLHYEHQESTRSVAGKVPAAPAELKLEEEVPQQPGQKLAANLSPQSPAEYDRDFGAAGKLSKQRAKDTDAAMRAGQAGAPALALEQDKKGQELSNNRLAAVRSGDVPVGAVPAAAPAPLSAAKTAGIEGQVRARNDALDSARASSETVTVESATPSREMATQTAERKAKDESRTNESQKEVQAAGGAGSVASLGERKADTFSGVTAQGAATAHAGRLRAGNNLLRWTLSRDGALQRSFDSGKTWQTIPVAGNIVFRALAANDSDIWVGGAAGALYHSSDSGQHWVRIAPVTDGKTLSSDIVTVEFSDTQHGKLITADRETWSTSDAGNTWQRQ